MQHVSGPKGKPSILQYCLCIDEDTDGDMEEEEYEAEEVEVNAEIHIDARVGSCARWFVRSVAGYFQPRKSFRVSMSSKIVSAPQTQAAPEDDDASPFDCHICFELAKDPVVTLCGHLYCWPCLCKWFKSQQGTRMCPVCKSDLEGGRVVPIYCRTDGNHQRHGHEVERRPAGQYLDAETSQNASTGMMPLNSEDVAPAPGILPTLFGISTGPHGVQMTPEQRHQAYLTRLLLVLGSFVILCLLLF